MGVHSREALIGKLLTSGRDLGTYDNVSAEHWILGLHEATPSDLMFMVRSQRPSTLPASRLVFYPCVRFFLLFQTQCFITAMDALKLEQRAVDEVQPLIYDLSDRLNKVSKLLRRASRFRCVWRRETGVKMLILYEIVFCVHDFGTLSTTCWHGHTYGAPKRVYLCISGMDLGRFRCGQFCPKSPR